MNLQSKKRLREAQMRAHRIKYPTFDERLRTVPNMTDNSANGLTKCIITFLKCEGHQAERINTMGTYRKGSKTINFWTGKVTETGGGYTPTTGTRGSADISATIHGRSVKIEVKYGKDRMSEYQKAYQADIERAGGVYVVARTFDDFLEWYDSFMGRIAL